MITFTVNLFVVAFIALILIFIFFIVGFCSDVFWGTWVDDFIDEHPLFSGLLTVCVFCGILAMFFMGLGMNEDYRVYNNSEYDLVAMAQELQENGEDIEICNKSCGNHYDCNVITRNKNYFTNHVSYEYHTHFENNKTKADEFDKFKRVDD